MNTEQRIRICRLIEKMQDQAEYSRRLGLEDTSRFEYREKLFLNDGINEKEQRNDDT